MEECVSEANRRVDTVTLSREQRKCFQTQENIEKSGTKLPGRSCGGFGKHRASCERLCPLSHSAFLFQTNPIGYGIDRRCRRLRCGTVLGPYR